MAKRHGVLKYFSLGALLLMVLFVTGCTLFGPGALPIQPVTDQTKLKPSDPRYVVELLADEELATISQELSETLLAKSLKDIFEGKLSVKTLAEEFDPSQILDIVLPHETFIKK
jgi:ATP/maltotriose-dependent transcriptional regulator MalT